MNTVTFSLAILASPSRWKRGMALSSCHVWDDCGIWLVLSSPLS